MDKKFLLAAIRLAQKNLGLTAPNPVVGCLIVKNGEIIASGITAPTGRPHAESIAINKVTDKEKLRGATLYVSLEPCCHYGKTSPCTDLIIKSGISRVVIAAIDIDERVSGKGISALQQAGIQVDIIELKEAFEINKAFFKAKKTGLPFVTLKLATSLDGKIATKNHDSFWITSHKAREFGHLLRSKNDAILIGANSLKKDDPLLSCRIKGLEAYSPARFVISKKIDFDENFKIFQTAKEISTTIITSIDNASYDFRKFENLGVKIIFCEEKNNSIDLELMLKKICASGINSILVEGGANLAAQFLKANLIDELFLIQNKKIIGGDGISAINSLGFEKISGISQNFTRKEIFEINDEDFVSVYKKYSTLNMCKIN